MGYSALARDHQWQSQKARNLAIEPGGLTDCELLGLLIESTADKLDGSAIAADLFMRFGSLAEILTARPTTLLNTAQDEQTACFLVMLHTMFVRALQSHAIKRPALQNIEDLYSYLHASMDNLVSEEVRLIFLSSQMLVIKEEIVSIGTVSSAPIYPREIVRRSLELGASAIIIVHNHPSGVSQPSSHDISATRRVVEACMLFDLVVIDHIIIAREGHFSFKSNGYL
jgi:DNA repair protein RadC